MAARAVAMAAATVAATLAAAAKVVAVTAEDWAAAVPVAEEMEEETAVAETEVWRVAPMVVLREV